LQKQLDDILRGWRDLATLPEHTPDEIEAKKARYLAFNQSEDAWLLNQIAAIPIAQFYLPKTPENLQKFVTDATYRRYWKGEMSPQGQATAEAWAMAERKRFFHWFLEFPEIIGRGGFDCLLGNPPYLGGKKISGQYGDAVLNLLKTSYSNSDGGVDLVSYFIRRASDLLKPSGYMAFITTKKICQGDTRLACLEYLLMKGARINYAKRSIKWNGRANLQVSLFALTKNPTPLGGILDEVKVDFISSFLDNSVESKSPEILLENTNLSFQGVVTLGPGFYIDASQAKALLDDDKRNADVVKIIVNGSTLNSSPELKGDQWIISFFDRSEEQAKAYRECYEIVAATVRNTRQKQKREHLRKRWWQYAEKRPLLYSLIAHNKRVLVRTQASKHNVFEFLDNGF
jgi:hypothetical protein